MIFIYYLYYFRTDTLVPLIWVVILILFVLYQRFSDLIMSNHFQEGC